MADVAVYPARPQYLFGHEPITVIIRHAQKTVVLVHVQGSVHGLPFHYAWQDLKDLFKPVGGVGKADIVLDRDGRSKGWGTVIFDSEDDAQKAIQVIYLLLLLLWLWLLCCCCFAVAGATAAAVGCCCEGHSTYKTCIKT